MTFFLNDGGKNGNTAQKIQMSDSVGKWRGGNWNHYVFFDQQQQGTTKN
jgi:hypothetical protein